MVDQQGCTPLDSAISFLIKCDIGRLDGLYKLSEPNEKPAASRPSESARAQNPIPAPTTTKTETQLDDTDTKSDDENNDDKPLTEADFADCLKLEDIIRERDAACANYTGPAVIGKITPTEPAPALADAPAETTTAPETPTPRAAPTEAEFEALEKKLGTTIGRSANIHDPKEVARLTEHAEYCADQKRKAKLRDEYVERTSPYKWPRGP